LEDGVEF